MISSIARHRPLADVPLCLIDVAYKSETVEVTQRVMTQRSDVVALATKGLVDSISPRVAKIVPTDGQNSHINSI